MNGVKSALKQFLAWARVSGFSWMVCAVLFLADEGTIGRLWANRQAAGYESVDAIIAGDPEPALPGAASRIQAYDVAGDGVTKRTRPGDVTKRG